MTRSISLFEITIELGSTEEECVEDTLSDEDICASDTGLPVECDPLIECAFGV